MLLTWTLWIVGIVLFQFIVSKALHGESGHRARQDPQSFPLRTELHLQRKAQHALTGLLFYVASWILPLKVAIPVVYVAAAAFYGVYQLRKTSPRIDALYITTFQGILRRDEATNAVLPGAFYFLLGSAVAATIYPIRVARHAILHLSVGDPAASLFGTLYGRKKEMTTTKTKRRTTAVAHNTKSWAGFYGAFLVSFLASFIALYVGDPETPGTTGSSDDDDGVLLVFSKAAFAGIAAAAAEAIDVGWDDNLSLPLLAGLFLQVGSFAFGFQY